MLYSNEEWRPIYGYEGNYLISNIGRVKSIDRFVLKGFCGEVKVYGKILSPQKNCKNGYMQINLKGKCLYLHRLVAKAFPEICGEWFNGCVIDHINTNKEDNRAENLRVCTYHENNLNELTCKKHSLSTKGKPNGRKGQPFLTNRGKNHHNSKIVIQLTMEGIEIQRFFGTGEASRCTGLCKSSIRACCVGKYSRAGNYKFVWGKSE